MVKFSVYLGLGGGYFYSNMTNYFKMNKHSDACIYLRPYKLDILKIVEYKFSCEMEAHVEVKASKRQFNV